MILTPKKIFEQLEGNQINKSTAFALLITIIENSENENTRIEAIRLLDEIGLYNDRLFYILENILISDLNEKMRNVAAKFIEKRFLNKALSPLKWAIKHETDYDCLITIYESLKQITSNESKITLFNEIKKIIKLKYLNKERRIENKKFKRTLKKLVKEKKFDGLSNEDLSEILINYLTIYHLTKTYHNVFYKLDSINGLVKELDLSDDMEYEVKGTPWGWKNNIKSLSEIIGLQYLKNLKKIDLSNNQIENLKEIVNLENLTHLILTNNRISELHNLEYIKKLSNLEYLDLRHNDIVKRINLNEFDKNIRVLLNDYLILK